MLIHSHLVLIALIFRLHKTGEFVAVSVPVLGLFSRHSFGRVLRQLVRDYDEEVPCRLLEQKTYLPSTSVVWRPRSRLLEPQLLAKFGFDEQTILGAQILDIDLLLAGGPLPELMDVRGFALEVQEPHLHGVGKE